MINTVILMGRLVADPELKTTQNGTSVTSFRIAVDRNYVKSGEDRKADFFDIVCWRNTAEFVCRYFGKGSLIAIQGQLQTRTYQAKDGTNRYVVEVMADTVSFTGERRDNTQQQFPPYGGNQSYQQPPSNSNKPHNPSGNAAAQQQGNSSYGYAPAQDYSYQQNPEADINELLDDDLPF